MCKPTACQLVPSPAPEVAPFFTTCKANTLHLRRLPLRILHEKHCSMNYRVVLCSLARVKKTRLLRLSTLP